MRHHKKYLTRLTRFFRLAKTRGIDWAVKHVDREMPNARRVYLLLMGSPVTAKTAAVCMMVSIMFQHHGWPFNASDEELSA